MNEQDNSQIETQKNEDAAPDANTTGQESDRGERGNPRTREEYEKAFLCLKLMIDAEYRFAHKLSEREAHTIDEIDAMDTLLKEHNIEYEPTILLNGVNNNNRDAESLFERNVVTRESLRKGEDGSAFKIVKYRRDDPCGDEEMLIAKNEAVEWLRRSGATDAEILGITGEKTVEADTAWLEGLDPEVRNDLAMQLADPLPAINADNNGNDCNLNVVDELARFRKLAETVKNNAD